MKWLHPEFGARDKSVSEQWLCDYAVTQNLTYSELLYMARVYNKVLVVPPEFWGHYKEVTK